MRLKDRPEDRSCCSWRYFTRQGDAGPAVYKSCIYNYLESLARFWSGSMKCGASISQSNKINKMNRQPNALKPS